MSDSARRFNPAVLALAELRYDGPEARDPQRLAGIAAAEGLPLHVPAPTFEYVSAPIDPTPGLRLQIDLRKRMIRDDQNSLDRNRRELERLQQKLGVSNVADPLLTDEVQQAVNVLRAGDATRGEQIAIFTKVSSLMRRLRPIEIGYRDAVIRSEAESMAHADTEGAA